MFHRHQSDIFQPEAASASANGPWYVSDEDYKRAIQRGMRLRSEMAFGLVKAAARQVGKFARELREATPAGAQPDDAAIVRRADGSIDIEHYEALARQARAEVAGDVLRAAGAWLGSVGSARQVRHQALAGA